MEPRSQPSDWAADAPAAALAAGERLILIGPRADEAAVLAALRVEALALGGTFRDIHAGALAEAMSDAVSDSPSVILADARDLHMIDRGALAAAPRRVSVVLYNAAPALSGLVGASATWFPGVSAPDDPPGISTTYRHKFGPAPLLITLGPARSKPVPTIHPSPSASPAEAEARAAPEWPPPSAVPPSRPLPLPYRRPVFIGPGLIALAALLGAIVLALALIDAD